MILRREKKGKPKVLLTVFLSILGRCLPRIYQQSPDTTHNPKERKKKTKENQHLSSDRISVCLMSINPMGGIYILSILSIRSRLWRKSTAYATLVFFF